MYYKEEVINGVLCCKHTPDGEWVPFSKEKLTNRIIRLDLENTRLKEKLEYATRKLHEPI